MRKIGHKRNAKNAENIQNTSNIEDKEARRGNDEVADKRYQKDGKVGNNNLGDSRDQ